MIELRNLTVYRDILKDEVIQKYLSVIDTLNQPEVSFFDSFTQNYCDFLNILLKCQGNFALGEYLLSLILYDDNIFTRGSTDESVQNAVKFDLNRLRFVFDLDANELKNKAFERLENEEQKELIKNLPEFSIAIKNTGLDLMNLDNLQKFHRENGFGIFAKYRFFIWNDGIVPIENYDEIRFRDLIGYENQIRTVVQNTKQFLSGFRASNVLLYGDRGVGKSSTVKALANEFYRQGLRMIELPLSKLDQIIALFEQIKNVHLKFIIYIDDFVLSQEHGGYHVLKSMLEGSVIKRPDNVLVYATGNRRHLLKETFLERGEEVNRADAIQDQLSLSDRFPITVTYLAPTKEEYLKIVMKLAQKEQIIIDEDTLFSEAMIWQMHYNGMSPRTAVNFISQLKYKKMQKKLANQELL